MNKYVKFLNINILSISQKDLLANMNSGFLVTPNIDHMVMLQNDKEFYNVYVNADWVICDSRILYFISKIFKERIKESIPGSSFFSAFCDYHKENNEVKIFLLGAANGVAKEAMLKINKRIGRDIIVGAHSPSYGFEEDIDECESIIEMINKSTANVLVVGVGAPKQEKWIYKHKSKLLKINIFMPLGATIDFEAGNIKRAPLLFQKIGLEWFYRMLKEPKRMFKRYVLKDSVFFIYIIKQLLGVYKNPFNK